MQSNGIEGLLIETHNWGKTVAFWQGLGYEIEFETDHHSGQLRHPRGGPYIFVAERPPDQALKVVLAVGVVPVLVSNVPFPSRSHSYLAIVPSRSFEAEASNCTVSPTFAVAGALKLATGRPLAPLLA